MSRNFKLIWIFALYILFGLGSLNAEDFVYDSHGKKDPFSPPVIGVVETTDKEQLAGVKLEGIIWDEENPIAVINDKVVSIGDEVAGAKIVGMTRNEVTFEVDGQQVELKLRIIEEEGK